ncbi:hypothetical protein BGX26_000462 [Mortierella sp. AD094]|nr:hypothetical protein BGX26_000462 [Mortierella sp. AD094]
MTDTNQDELPRALQLLHMDGVSGTITSQSVTESQDSNSREHSIPLNELARGNSLSNSRNSVHAAVDSQELETETKSFRTINSTTFTAAASPIQRDHPEAPATHTEPTTITVAPLTTTGTMGQIEQDNTVPDYKNSGNGSNNQAQNSVEGHSPSILLDGHTTTENRDKKEMEDNYNKGFAYYHGKGTAQDYPKAFEYLYKAAKQGHVGARHKLGYMYDHGRGYIYLNGRGVTKNPSKAVEWYQKAAIQGEPTAQHNLALAYEVGRGIAKDFTKAAEWYQISANNGYSKAQLHLGIMYQKGHGLTPDYSKAAEWYEKAASRGNTTALKNLGLIYEIGSGVTQDYTKAAELYKTAASEGDRLAQYKLGSLYRNGYGVSKNFSKAVELYRRAARRGYLDSRHELGILYFNGEGVLKDMCKTMECWELAIDLRDAR